MCQQSLNVIINQGSVLDSAESMMGSKVEGDKGDGKIFAIKYSTGKNLNKKISFQQIKLMF